MADIYTPEWYDDVRDAMNTRVATMQNLPTGALQIKVEIVGDGCSPYVAQGSERHFLISIEEGHCAWYREVEGDDPALKLDYRFRGPAAVFDEIAAGLEDPINAALHGTVKVRGDMRFLMRQAEHVKVLLEAYASGVHTSWPLGSPPYAADREEAVGA
jgi:putative sterol carrier protein